MYGTLYGQISNSMYCEISVLANLNGEIPVHHILYSEISVYDIPYCKMSVW